MHLRKGRHNTSIKLKDKAPLFGSEAGLLCATRAENIVFRGFAVYGTRANQDESDAIQNKKRSGIHFTLVNYVKMYYMVIGDHSGNGGK